MEDHVDVGVRYGTPLAYEFLSMVSRMFPGGMVAKGGLPESTSDTSFAIDYPWLWYEVPVADHDPHVPECGVV